MAVLLENLEVIQSVELTGVHGNHSRVYITPEWSTFISDTAPYERCHELAFVPHAGFVLASMIQVANVPLPINRLDKHLGNVASVAKIKNPSSTPCPLYVDGVFDKTRKATALRSLEFGTFNPVKYHFFRIGNAPAKTALILFCADISSTENGVSSLRLYHEKLDSTESRTDTDITFFTREYKRRKKIEDVRLELRKKSAQQY